MPRPTDEEIRAELEQAIDMREDVLCRLRHGLNSLGFEIACNQGVKASERIFVLEWVLGETKEKPWRDDDDER